MSDLVSRLLAAIEETERLALAASPGPWRANAEHDEVLAVDGEIACEGFALSSNQLRATVDHIVHNDPAAVLRRCAADKAAVLWFKAGMDRLERLNHVAERRPLTAAESADRAVTVVVVSEGHDYMTFMASAYGISVEEETTGE